MVFLIAFYLLHADIRIPVDAQIPHLTEIGMFGIYRKARPGIPGHLHTGIDIRRPGNNYHNEPIYPIAEGTVISRRDDGPYAQLIIEHKLDGKFIWTLYEHIAGIRVPPGKHVTPDIPIARFFNREELNKFGWQFDHFHFEILKRKPLKITPSPDHPHRHYRSYTLECFTKKELESFFYNPMDFLMGR